jgi:hypothetical protein
MRKMTTMTIEETRENLLQIVRDLPDEKMSSALSLLHKLQEDDGDPYPDDPLLSGNF